MIDGVFKSMHSIIAGNLDLQPSSLDRNELLHPSAEMKFSYKRITFHAATFSLIAFLTEGF